MSDENELLFDELYEKTKDCGRVQFIKLLMQKEREIQELKEKVKELSKWDKNKDSRNSRQRIANKNLLKKINELKKQLENCYCNRTDCTGRIKDSKQYDSLVQRVENQQKEFINYMMNTIENITHDETDDEEIKGYLIQRGNTFKEILSKYKSIIGGK